MELLYVDTIRSDIQIDSEYYHFIINYIVGQKVNIHSNVGFYFHVVKNINKLKEYEYLECFENLLLQQSSSLSPELLGMLSDKDDFIQKSRNIKKLRSKRILSKIERELIILTDEYLNQYKIMLLKK